jgi:hypothetical protein
LTYLLGQHAHQDACEQQLQPTTQISHEPKENRPEIHSIFASSLVSNQLLLPAHSYNQLQIRQLAT